MIKRIFAIILLLSANAPERATADCGIQSFSHPEAAICHNTQNVRVAATVDCLKSKPILCDGSCSAGGGACGLGYDKDFKQICECGH